jgi:hypothetical protein
MNEFFSALAGISVRLNPATFAFENPDGSRRGFVQFLRGPHNELRLHRLWVLKTGIGHGSLILRTVCELADQHAVEIFLKAAPFGEKPFPMSRDALAAWYRRHGFEGTRWNLARKPRSLI